MTTSDDELIDLLQEFSQAFADQDAQTLGRLFDTEDVCFIASEPIVVHDRPRLEAYLAAYAGQPVASSFEWDSCQVSGGTDSGWVSAFGRQVRHEDGASTPSDFRVTLACRRRRDGWRIVQLHASMPVG